MSRMRSLTQRFQTLRELLGYLWEQRLWWLIPVVAVLILVGSLLVFAQGSALAPFVYTLF